MKHYTVYIQKWAGGKWEDRGFYVVDNTTNKKVASMNDVLRLSFSLDDPNYAKNEIDYVVNSNLPNPVPVLVDHYELTWKKKGFHYQYPKCEAFLTEEGKKHLDEVHWIYPRTDDFHEIGRGVKKLFTVHLTSWRGCYYITENKSDRRVGDFFGELRKQVIELLKEPVNALTLFDYVFEVPGEPNPIPTFVDHYELVLNSNDNGFTILPYYTEQGIMRRSLEDSGRSHEKITPFGPMRC